MDQTASQLKRFNGWPISAGATQRLLKEALPKNWAQIQYDNTHKPLEQHGKDLSEDVEEGLC